MNSLFVAKVHSFHFPGNPHLWRFILITRGEASATSTEAIARLLDTLGKMRIYLKEPDEEIIESPVNSS